MATKKQKRLALETKREVELAETRRSGLIAQAKDRERRQLIADVRLAKEAQAKLDKANKKAAEQMKALAAQSQHATEQMKVLASKSQHATEQMDELAKAL